MEFEWDQAKAARNLTKHQVSFDEAKLAVSDRYRVEFRSDAAARIDGSPSGRAGRNY